MIRDKHYLKLSHFAYETEVGPQHAGICLREMRDHAPLTTTVDLTDMGDWYLLMVREDHCTGFYGVAIQHMPTNITVIAYRGSEWRLKEPGDLIADLSLITPFNQLIGCQLEQATQFYDEVAGVTCGNPIYLTGHSLGGALAQKVALERGCRAVSFNGPGVLQIASVVEKLNDMRGAYNDLILNYVESGDIFLGNNPLFPHPGKVVRLDSFMGEGSVDVQLFLNVVQFKYHGMSNFYNDLDAEGNMAGSRIESGVDLTSQLLNKLRGCVREIRQRLREMGTTQHTIQLGKTGEVVLAEQSA